MQKKNLKKIYLIVQQCIEYDNDNKTKIVNKTVNKNDNKTIIVNITFTKTNNKTKLFNENVKNSCKVYIILTIISIIICTVNTICFVYYNWFLIKNKDLFTKYNTRKETIIW